EVIPGRRMGRLQEEADERDEEVIKTVPGISARHHFFIPFNEPFDAFLQRDPGFAAKERPRFCYVCTGGRYVARLGGKETEPRFFAKLVLQYTDQIEDADSSRISQVDD